MDVRKKDGGVYEPGTPLHRSREVFSADNNSNTNILKDQEFAKSREVLTATKRDLVVNNAKRNRPQVARELTKGEEDLLFQTGQFGEDDPEVLQRTVWWMLSLTFRFCTRSSQEICRKITTSRAFSSNVGVVRSKKYSFLYFSVDPFKEVCPLALTENPERSRNQSSIASCIMFALIFFF